MSQIFRRSANAASRVLALGRSRHRRLPAVGVLLLMRSDFVTGANANVTQPVQFSHEHHVGGLGIDCRYCHTSVETSAFAGIPPTETCMNCHSQIWTDSPMLEPVRDELAGPASRSMDPGPRPARLRLLQPQHPRREGRRLRDLPRPRRPDAADVAGRAAAHGVVPRLPPRTRAAPPAARGGLQHGLAAAERDQLELGPASS